ncbi:DUF5719 family protein [Acanthopleuribacter pedis]|uniref:S8 family serine peptidase n=1 Tax=Acanthopleuribacter pedis TaxID=442870 RepID=A0A8J7QE40_9BACT|nr:S8 family serine peptidase [Acanthopleuribacter pedis]MBO1317960.1 S8 family serine peptidase [Acanthopleuribacter pedis]
MNGTRLFGAILAALCLAASPFLHAMDRPEPETGRPITQLPTRLKPADLPAAVARNSQGPAMQLTPTERSNGWILIYEPDDRHQSRAAAKQSHDLVAQAAKAVDARIRHSFRGRNGTTYALLDSDAQPDGAGLTRRFAKQGRMRLVPNQRYRLNAAFPGNDPLVDQQWPLRNHGKPLQPGAGAPLASAHIDLAGAWQQQSGSDTVIVAVLDTGIDYEHPDLAANMWHNSGEIPGNQIDDDQNGFVDDVHGHNFAARFFSDDTLPRDLIGHGTHVAGTIGAVSDNGVGISGVNRNVSLMACRVFDDSGYTDDFILSQGIEYAVANGARIINASLGGPSPGAALETAVRNAADAGVLFVASAGNAGFYLGSRFSEVSAYPAQFDLPNILTVAATDNTDQLAPYSNFGESAVDLAAPGSAVLSTLPGMLVIYQENFDSIAEGALPAGYRRGGADNTWGVTDALAGNGNRALRADASAAFPYRGTGDGWLDLPQMTGDQFLYDFGASIWVSFDVSAAMSEGTRFTIEMVRDNGTSMWIDLGSSFHAFDGDNYARIEGRLPNFSFETMNLRLHWRAAPAGADHFGLEIDNLRIYQVARERHRLAGQADFDQAYGVYSGTSMAAPHVAGVAALLLAENPAMGLNELKMRLATTGDPLPALHHKTLSGRRLNAARALSASGGLQWVNRIETNEIRLGDSYPLLWSNLAAPDAVTEMVLLRDGQPLPETRVSVTDSAGMLLWHVPAVPAGDGYQLQLETADTAAQTAVFAIQPFVAAEINDPGLARLLTENLDQNNDQHLSEREFLRYQGPLAVFDDAILDYTSLNQLADQITFLGLISKNARVLPDLARFEKVQTLVLANGDFTSVDALPPSVQNLIIQDLPLVDLAPIPASVKELAFQNLNLTNLPDLPEELNSLLLNTVPLQTINRWPDQIGFTALSHLPLRSLPDFHQRGGNVFLENLPLTSLPVFPSGMGSLYVLRTALEATPDLDYLTKVTDLAFDFNPNLKQLGALPPMVGRLSLRENALTALPVLPDTVDQLFAGNNQLTALPNPLPPRLNFIFAQGNRLTSLPPMAEDMAFLDVSRNQLTELPDFSAMEYMVHLNAAYNQLRAADQLPRAMDQLNLAGNQLTDIAAMPFYMSYLNLADNQLDQLPPWPDQINLAFLNLAGNQFSQPPSLPEGAGWMCINLEGNPFDQASCAALDSIAALNPNGCAFGEYDMYSPTFDPLDGFLATRDHYGVFLGCEAVGSDQAVAGLTATRSGFNQVTLRWLPAGPAGVSLAGYRIYEEHQGTRHEIAFTQETQAVVHALPGKSHARFWVVVPVDRANNEYDVLAGTLPKNAVNQTMPTTNHHRFPALSQFGVTRHQLKLRGPGNSPFLGGRLAAIDAAGTLLAETFVWGNLGLADDTVALETLFSPETVASAARFECTTLIPSQVRLVAHSETDACHVPNQGAPSHGGFLGLAPEWLAEESAVLTITNPGDIAATIRQIWYDQSGATLGESEFLLDAGETIQRDALAEVPEDVDRAAVGAMRWLSDEPVSAAAIFTETNFHGSDLFVARANGRARLKGWFPAQGHFVRIANPGGQTAVVTFDLIDHEGRVVSTRATTLAANSSALWNTSSHWMDQSRDDRLSRNLSWRFEASHPVQVALEISGFDLHGLTSEVDEITERIEPLGEGQPILTAASLNFGATNKSALWLINTANQAGTVHLFFQGEGFDPIHRIVLPIAEGGRLEIDETTLLGRLPESDITLLREVQILAGDGVRLNGYSIHRDLLNDNLTTNPLGLK